MGAPCAQQLGPGPLPSYTLGYIYRPDLSSAIPPLWPPLILRQGWKKGIRGLEPSIAFLRSTWSGVSPSCINSICFSLSWCSLPGCFSKVLSFIVLLIFPQGTYCLPLITFALHPRPFPLQKEKVTWKPLSEEISPPPSPHTTALCSPLWAFTLCCMAICNKRYCLQKPCFIYFDIIID